MKNLTGLFVALVALVGLTGLSATGCNAFVDIEEQGANECDVYCNIMMEGCNQTFAGDRDACYTACNRFPLVEQFDEAGNVIPYGERVGNSDTFECRIYHGQTAMNIARDNPMAENNTHCEEAAPIGGGTCSDAPLECAQACYNEHFACAPPEEFTEEDVRDCEDKCAGQIETASESAEAKFECAAEGYREAANSKRAGDEVEQNRFCIAAKADAPCVAVGVLQGRGEDAGDL